MIDDDAWCLGTGADTGTYTGTDIDIGTGTGTYGIQQFHKHLLTSK